jgi:hypothetical protein
MANAVDQEASALNSFHSVETNITPPNSADGKKNASEGVPSELSDLDLDHNAAAPSVEAVEEDIEPDHFYEGGRIPVFKPVSRDHRTST